jgi:polysaccharide export outer membrane protein
VNTPASRHRAEHAGSVGTPCRRAAAIVLLALLPGCLATTPTAPPPRGPEQEAGAPYLLKVGDSLDIRFYKTPELNVEEVPIRSDGKISLELLGDVQAAGLAPDELSRRLTERYASELEDPRVTVIVRAFGGQVYVGGEVKTPSALPFATGMTALQAISGSGGFLDTARLDHAVLIRQVAGGRYEGHRLILDRALSGEDLSQDVALRPSDIIHIPKSRIANLNLFVEQYIRNNLPVQPSIGSGVF